MNSQQRRYERYRIIYTWKVLEGLVPNCGIKQAHSSQDRQGRKFEVPPLMGIHSVKTQRDHSLQVHGPKLFNILPPKIRNITKCGVDDFKEKLDSFLTNIPDQPNVGELQPATCEQANGHPSNSLVDQILEYQKTQTPNFSSKFGSGRFRISAPNSGVETLQT